MDVSVIMPVFDTRPDLLEAAVRSVLEQIGDHAIELILIDDASSNAATVDAMARLARGPRVSVVRMPVNAGPSVARAAGVAAARHDWIGFVDADDLWKPSRLERSAALLLDRPDSRWIAGGYVRLLEDGTVEPGLSPADRLAASRARIAPPELTDLLVTSWLPLGASLVRRDLLSAAGGFDPLLRYGEDWLLSLRMSALSPMDCLGVPTYILRRQGASMMRSSGRMSAGFARSVAIARRDPALAGVRQRLRWYDYAIRKDLAMNNAINGRRLRGLVWALRALAVDPRETRDFALFLRSLGVGRDRVAASLRGYSSAEQVILSRLAPPVPTRG